MCFMATVARCMARKVSWLMLADSIAFICCSMVPIWLSVCSRLCSWVFLRRSAAFAAIGGGWSSAFLSRCRAVVRSDKGDKPTSLVGRDVLPCDLFLLFYLAREMGLALLQHLQLRPQVEDDIFGRLLALLGGATAKPAPDTRHGDAVEAGTDGRGRDRQRELAVRVDRG